MVTRSEKVAIRFVTANLADRMEQALDDLSKAKLLADCDILGSLLQQLSISTRIANPEISQQAHGLAKVFTTAKRFMKDEFLEAVQSARDLIESAVF